MITPSLIDHFLASVRGQAEREGQLYARSGWVADISGTAESLSVLVEGKTGDYEVVLWSEYGVLQHRCSCPSWRDPCKHEVAAALVLREQMELGGTGKASEVKEPTTLVEGTARQHRRSKAPWRWRRARKKRTWEAPPVSTPSPWLERSRRWHLRFRRTIVALWRQCSEPWPRPWRPIRPSYRPAEQVHRPLLQSRAHLTQSSHGRSPG